MPQLKLIRTIGHSDDGRCPAAFVSQP